MCETIKPIKKHGNTAFFKIELGIHQVVGTAKEVDTKHASQQG